MADQHAVEFTIRIVGERPWNPRTKLLVEQVLRVEASDAIDTAARFARLWTEHGEPCTSNVTFREVRLADAAVKEL